MFRRAHEERRAVPESYAARGVRRDVLVERGRAEGSVVTAASPTHAVLPARDTVEGRGDPAPRPRNDEMRSLDGDARFTSMPPASTVRARPLDGGGAQGLVGHTRRTSDARVLFGVWRICIFLPSPLGVVLVASFGVRILLC